jgi:polyferredoxin
MTADTVMVMFVVFVAGFTLGSVVKGWICEAMELREAWKEATGNKRAGRPA